MYDSKKYITYLELNETTFDLQFISNLTFNNTINAVSI